MEIQFIISLKFFVTMILISMIIIILILNLHKITSPEKSEDLFSTILLTLDILGVLFISMILTYFLMY